jgi:hypothetical protein
MDVQLRKIHFFKEFLRLNNEQAIEKLETLLKAEKQRIYSTEPEPMSSKELDKIIDNAEKDAKAGRIVNVRDLKRDIQSWS